MTKTGNEGQVRRLLRPEGDRPPDRGAALPGGADQLGGRGADGAEHRRSASTTCRSCSVGGTTPAGPDREQCAFGAGTAIGREAAGSCCPHGRMRPEARSRSTPGRTTSSPSAPPTASRPPSPPTTSPTSARWTPTSSRLSETFANGTGEVEFELQDGIQADHLGCGVNTAPAGSDPGHAPCWLVVVPRGTHDANGREDRQPGSASSTARDLAALRDELGSADGLPPGLPARSTTSARRARRSGPYPAPSWRTTPSRRGGRSCAPPRAARSPSTRAPRSPPGTRSLGTTRTRPAWASPSTRWLSRETATDVVHAPVAVSGLAIGFFIESAPSGVMQEMKLTPRLVAKMLTHSYVRDVPLDQDKPTPEHVKGNPLFLLRGPGIQGTESGIR